MRCLFLFTSKSLLIGFVTTLALATATGCGSGAQMRADPTGRYYVVFKRVKFGPLPARTRYTFAAAASGAPAIADTDESPFLSADPPIRDGDSVIAKGELSGELAPHCVSDRGNAFLAAEFAEDVFEAGPIKAVFVEASPRRDWRVTWPEHVAFGNESQFGELAGRCWFRDAIGEILLADNDGGIAVIDAGKGTVRPGGANDLRFLFDSTRWEDRQFGADVAGHGKFTELKPVLITELMRLDSPMLTRLHMATALHWLGDDRGSPLMLAAADAAANETDTHCDPVCDYVSQYLRLIPVDRALPRLLALVEKKTDSRWAMTTIGLFGDDAIPVLMKIVRDPNHPELRDDSLAELSRIRSERSVTALLSLLDDPDQTLRSAAVDTAKETTEPRFAPEILRARSDGLCDDECLASYFRWVRYPEALPELRVARARVPRDKPGKEVRSNLDIFLDLAIEKQELTSTDP